MSYANRNKDFLILVDFWISEFLILILSNYYRWMTEWDLMGVIISVVIVLISVQYCILHIMRLHKRLVKWYFALLVEGSYILSTLFIIVANMFWLSHSHQINFGVLFVLTLILSPMIVVNSKLLKKQS